MLIRVLFFVLPAFLISIPLGNAADLQAIAKQVHESSLGKGDKLLVLARTAERDLGGQEMIRALLEAEFERGADLVDYIATDAPTASQSEFDAYLAGDDQALQSPQALKFEPLLLILRDVNLRRAARGASSIVLHALDSLVGCPMNGDALICREKDMYLTLADRTAGFMGRGVLYANYNHLIASYAPPGVLRMAYGIREEFETLGDLLQSDDRLRGSATWVWLAEKTSWLERFATTPPEWATLFRAARNLPGKEPQVFATELPVFKHAERRSGIPASSALSISHRFGQLVRLPAVKETEGCGLTLQGLRQKMTAGVLYRVASRFAK